MSLTDAKIHTLKPSDKPYKVSDFHGPFGTKQPSGCKSGSVTLEIVDNPGERTLHSRAWNNNDRTNIDLILRTVDADTLPQREWDWLKQLKPMNPSPMMITTALLQHRGDNAAMNRLQTLPDIN